MVFPRSILILFVVSFSTAQASAEPSEFKLTDYEEYFQQGVYHIFYVEYYAWGTETITEIRVPSDSKSTDLHWVSDELFIMENSVHQTEFPFIKETRKSHEIEGQWDPESNQFAYRVGTPFDEDAIERRDRILIWLSHDWNLEISPDDYKYGSDTEFYRDALGESDGACCDTENEFETRTVGTTFLKCAFIDHPKWEVQCSHTNSNSGSQTTVLYDRVVAAVS
jgi:hypothetical protein